MSSKRKARNKEEEVVPTPTAPHVNTTVKQYPKRPSPLAGSMVAPGFVYDMSTGLVRPAYKPPVVEEEEE